MTSNIRSVVVAGAVATVINDWQLSGTAANGSYVSMAATCADVMRGASSSTSPGPIPFSSVEAGATRVVRHNRADDAGDFEAVAELVPT